MGIEMDAAVWKSADLAHRYLTGVRGAIPLAAEQIETLLRLIAAAGIPVRRVLDLGCGDGVLAAAVLDRFPGATAVGVDFSESMLAAGRARFASRPESVQWILADYGQDDWTKAVVSSGPFDVVVSGFSIHHQVDAIKRRIYGDCFDLLVPGGVFLNLEHVSPGSTWDAAAAETQMIDHLHAHARAGGDSRSREAIAAEFHHRPDKAANKLSSVAAQCAWLRSIGFVQVDCFFRQFEFAVFGGRRPAERREDLSVAALPEGIRVVPIEEEHIERFHAAVDSVARERKYLMVVEAFPLDATRYFVLGNVRRGHPQFVAMDGDTLVGWCDVVPANPFPGFGHSGRLGMGIVASHRGRGIGRALVATALKAAVAAGFRRVELDVFSDNPAAIALYRSVGFAVEGIKRGARDLDGVKCDVIAMVWHPRGGAA